jgi:hypothetical protein
MELTPLELAILRIYHARYASLGFPEPRSISVVSREIEGGKWLVLSHPGSAELADDLYWMGNFSHIECSGLPHGAFVELSITAGKVDALDLYPCGNADWDEGEEWWGIVDPNSGTGYVVTSDTDHHVNSDRR